jgi:hypothetical protein
MKKTFCLWVLLTSILVNLCAQSRNKPFEVPNTIVFNHKFIFNFDNKNKLDIWVTNTDDLQRLGNLDSIVRVFLKDIEPLKDSLADEFSAKSISYVADAQDRKTIRLMDYPVRGNTFLVDKSGLAALRTVQDTIHLLNILPDISQPTNKSNLKGSGYYSLTFYLNYWSEIQNYLDWQLNKKMKTLQASINGKWISFNRGKVYHLQADSTITAYAPQGGRSDWYDIFESYIAVNAQNYKNYFLPSFSVGLRATITDKKSSYKWVPGILWEPHFFFSKNAQNELKTYRNDFVTLTYAAGGIKDHSPRKEFAYSSHVSFSFLVHRSGDYFDNNTCRIGAGQVHVLKTTIEPSFYYTDFFKGVSPSIKISQAF